MFCVAANLSGVVASEKHFRTSSAGHDIPGGKGTMDRTLERSTMRKVYLRLLPFAVLSYVLAYIDRINVSFAGLTMRGDLGMSAGTFGFAVGLFYWGYFIFEVPSNVILEKVGARIWIARIMITWGILRSEEHTSELQSHSDLVCRLLLEK